MISSSQTFASSPSSPGGGLLMLFPCSTGGFSHGHNSPWTSPEWFLPRGAVLTEFLQDIPYKGFNPSGIGCSTMGVTNLLQPGLLLGSQPPSGVHLLHIYPHGGSQHPSAQGSVPPGLQGNLSIPCACRAISASPVPSGQSQHPRNHKTLPCPGYSPDLMHWDMIPVTFKYGFCLFF